MQTMAIVTGRSEEKQMLHVNEGEKINFIKELCTVGKYIRTVVFTQQVNYSGIGALSYKSLSINMAYIWK